MKSAGKVGAGRRVARLAPWLVAMGIAASGCQRDEVQHFRVAKGPKPAAGATPASMAGAPPGMQGEVAPPPAIEGGGLAWSLPTGWTESRTGGMRYATLKPPVEGKIDVSVTVLSGGAGGELANVNRWRDQIGLPPLDAAALASARQTAKAPAGALAVYDFTSTDGGSRVVAALAERGGSTWFVKLSGDARPVAAARADFMKLLGSLRFDDRS